MASVSLLDTTTNLHACVEIRHRNRRFRIACQQLVQLNNLIEELEARYERANSEDLRSFRYSHRLRLCTLEGVRNVMYEWASAEAEELEEMMDRFHQRTGIYWTEDLAMDADDQLDADKVLG